MNAPKRLPLAGARMKRAFIRAPVYSALIGTACASNEASKKVVMSRLPSPEVSGMASAELYVEGSFPMDAGSHEQLPSHGPQP